MSLEDKEILARNQFENPDLTQVIGIESFDSGMVVQDNEKTYPTLNYGHIRVTMDMKTIVDTYFTSSRHERHTTVFSIIRKK